MSTTPTPPPPGPRNVTLTIDLAALRRSLTPTNVVIGLLAVMTLMLFIDTLAVLRAWSAYNDLATLVHHLANIGSGNGF
jgi:hypothetical protein